MNDERASRADAQPDRHEGTLAGLWDDIQSERRIVAMLAREPPPPYTAAEWNGSRWTRRNGASPNACATVTCVRKGIVYYRVHVRRLRCPVGDFLARHVRA